MTRKLKRRVSREWALTVLRRMRHGSLNPGKSLEDYLDGVVRRVYIYAGEQLDNSKPERLLAGLRRLDVVSYLEEQECELRMQNKKRRAA